MSAEGSLSRYDSSGDGASWNAIGTGCGTISGARVTLGHFLLCVRRRILRIDGPDGYSDDAGDRRHAGLLSAARRAAMVDPSVVFRDDDLESVLRVSDRGCAGVAAICCSLPHPAKATTRIVRKPARSRSLGASLNLRVLGSIPRRLTSIPINDLRGRRIHPIEKSAGDPQIVSLCGIAAVTQTLDVRAPKCQNARPTIPDGGMAVPVGDGFFRLFTDLSTAI